MLTHSEEQILQQSARTIATVSRRQPPPLEALLLTSTQQKKIVRRTARRDFALFALHIAVAGRQRCGFVSSSLLFILMKRCYNAHNYCTQNVQQICLF
jgi:hypothetical protein